MLHFGLGVYRCFRFATGALGAGEANCCTLGLACTAAHVCMACTAVVHVVWGHMCTGVGSPFQQYTASACCPKEPLVDTCCLCVTYCQVFSNLHGEVGTAVQRFRLATV
jgi:hypothetical protein